ncbi:MAG TPA: DUF4410 domain-containing protein [Vicinamibacterales bacterium]|jgi:hypothetical protein
MNHVAVTSALVLAVNVLPGQAPIKTIEDGALDRIELFVRALEHPERLTLDVVPFDVAGVDLGTGSKDGKDARQQEAKTIQNDGPRLLAESVVSALQGAPFRSVRMASAKGDAVAEEGLVLEGRFVQIDPGSRAKRYFVGFGAGKSSVKVVGTVKDRTGRLLASFEQRRIGAVGMGGGDSLGKLMSDTKSIGQDIGKFLARWARGASLE